MSGAKRKVMLLAAGRGRRMLPFTLTQPKCLVPVAGKPLIYYHLEALAAVGLTDIVINVSHCAEVLQDNLGDGKRFGVDLTYSVEPSPLETGGGIFQALPHLGAAPFIILSSDIWTDYPFARLRDLSFTEPTQQLHLVLVTNPSHVPNGDFYLHGDRVRMVGEASQRFTYANMALCDPRLFSGCQPGCFPLRPLFQQAIQAGHVQGELYRGVWQDIGTPARLDALNQEQSL